MPAAFAYFGTSVEIGDINGDGSGDIAVSAVWFSDVPGRVFLFSGQDGSLIRTHEHPDPEPNCHNTGGCPLYGFADDALAMGDVDDDGLADVLVGASGTDADGVENRGRAYLYSGADGSLRVIDPPDDDSFSFGGRIAMGDINADGQQDLVIYAGNKVHVLDGPSGGVIHTLYTPNPQLGSQFGLGLSAGDVTGDGHADILVGAPWEDTGPFGDQGRAYLFDGATGLLLRTIDSPNPQSGAVFADEMAIGKDVDGDGIGDLLIGAQHERTNLEDEGRVYLFSGATGAHIYTFAPPAPAPAYGRFGLAVGLADIDNNGRADPVITTLNSPFVNQTDTDVHVHFSGSSGFLTETFFPAPGTAGGLALGDVTGDGKADVALGSAGEYVGTNANQGRAYVYTLSAGDSDGDGVFDPDDNCAAAPNADQADQDGDGAGDVCDPDIDGDGSPNAMDVCVMVPGPPENSGCPQPAAVGGLVETIVAPEWAGGASSGFSLATILVAASLLALPAALSAILLSRRKN